MIAAFTLLTVLTVSVFITRVAAIALSHTGLSRPIARIQARSAFTGVGFTTQEAEKVVNHPVRRRILMLLMLLGNVGIVTAVSSMMLTFIGQDVTDTRDWLIRAGLLVVGITALWTAAWSSWLDRHLSRVINRALERWTDLDTRDYSNLLHLGGEYAVTELHVQEEDWLAEQTLLELGLRDEGLIVLGVQTPDGEYHGVPTRKTRLHAGDVVVLYGRQKAMENLDQRGKEVAGRMSHLEGVAEQRKLEQ
jgi:hypothetical protein